MCVCVLFLMPASNAYAIAILLMYLAAKLFKLSHPLEAFLVHVVTVSHGRMIFIFDPGFASNFQWQSKCALKTLVHTSC